MLAGITTAGIDVRGGEATRSKNSDDLLYKASKTFGSMSFISFCTTRSKTTWVH